jgi:predicted ester cyclase
MTTQLDNKAIIRRFGEEAFNNGNLAAITETFAHQDAIEGMNHFITTLRAAFPDLHCTTETQVAEGDMIAQRVTLSGTQAGEWQGMTATGRKANWSAMVFLRFENGKVVEQWVIADELSVMRQLGAIPQSNLAAN